MAKAKKSEADPLEDDIEDQMERVRLKETGELPFSVVADDIVRRANKRTKAIEVESLIHVGILPITFCRLRWTEYNPTDDDRNKYVVTFSLTKGQREAVIDTLVPVGLELADKKGIDATEKEVRTVLRGKIKERDEGSGEYFLVADQRMHYKQESGEITPIGLSVLGPGDPPEELTKLLLDRGTLGCANFLMVAMQNRQTGKLQFPFRLKAVKITHPVYFEGKGGGGNNDDFSKVAGGY